MKQNNKSNQLECIYLMNVSLYLPLQTIPTFIQINKKAKESIERLKINPIDSGNCYTREKELTIIQKAFPDIETIQLRSETIYQFVLFPMKYKSYIDDSIEHIRTNAFPQLSNQDLFEEHYDYNVNNREKSEEEKQFVKRIALRLNRRNYSSIYNYVVTDLKEEENQFDNCQHLKLSSSEISQLLSHIEKYPLGKRFKTITVSLYSLLDLNQFNLDFINKFNEIVDQFKQLKTITEYIILSCDIHFSSLPLFFRILNGKLPDYVVVRLPYLFGNEFFITNTVIEKIMSIENTEDIGKILDIINDELQPSTLVIGDHENVLPHQFLSHFTSPYKTILMNYTRDLEEERIIDLPENTTVIKTTISSSNNVQIVGNWDKLKSIQRIEHNNYNINVSPEFVDCLVNTQENKSIEQWRNILQMANQFVFFFYFPMIFVCIYFNGKDNLEKSVKQCFPLMCCQYFILAGLKAFRYIKLVKRKRKRFFYRDCLPSPFGYILHFILFFFIQSFLINTNKGYMNMIITYFFHIQMLMDHSLRHDKCRFSLQMEKFFNRFPFPLNYLLSFRIPFSIFKDKKNETYRMVINSCRVNMILQCLPYGFIPKIILSILYALLSLYFDLSEGHWDRFEYDSY